MTKTGAPLKTPATPKGILDLEFAYNKTKAAVVINAWSGTGAADNIHAAKINTWLDFIFLFFYALLLYYSCKEIAASFDGFLFITGRFLAKGALIAGLLDMLENAGMLITLNGTLSDSFTMLTVVFSLIKWVLALAGVVYTVVAGSVLLFRKISNNR